MDNYTNRITLICKPEQSGKTFVMIQQIINDLRDLSLTHEVINIILCDNNLLLTKQTSERVGKDLSEEVEINGVPYLEFSSHSRTEYRNVDAVVGAIIRKGIHNILCCTNGTRVADIYDIICDLNKSQFTKGKLFFKIWLDEADKFTGFIDDTFRPLVKKYENVGVYCITATPKKLFDRYHNINVFPLENTTSPEYHGWEDNDIRFVDSEAICDCFAALVLDNMGKDLIQPGTKWYIPAEHKKLSHLAVKDVCVKRGFAVIIVNGEGIKLFLPDGEMIMYKKDDELNTIIQKAYRDYELHKYPFAITGNVCIGRGISIMSEDFMMDYGILSSCHNQQEASQNSGRLKGNIKSWDTYKPPKVFTTENFNKVAVEWETKSRGLAELAFKKEAEGKSTIISKHEFKTVGEDYEYVIHDSLFKTFAKATGFLKTKKREMGATIKESKGSVIHETVDGGYSVTSKLLKPGKKVADLRSSDRITLEGASQIAPGSCISSTDKGSRYLILPVYESMDSPPKSVQFQVRYISFKE